MTHKQYRKNVHIYLPDNNALYRYQSAVHMYTRKEGALTSEARLPCFQAFWKAMARGVGSLLRLRLPGMGSSVMGPLILWDCSATEREQGGREGRGGGVRVRERESGGEVE